VKNTDTMHITLELGDIIETYASKNEDLNLKTFFITYIDSSQIDLTNVITFLPYKFKLDENSQITDESVDSIVLISRSEDLGYARQHLLLPKTWVDIHFSGEVPIIITGEITNLEEDSIEITTYPDFNVIYIDFEYKGIPKTIPLEQIIIRTKPASLSKIASLLDIRDQLEEGEVFDPTLYGIDEDASIEYNDVGEAIIHISDDTQPDISIRDSLRNLYLAADEIVYGEEIGTFTQNIELTGTQLRHGIETQVNDMLDVLLSDIPNERRNKSALDNIHLLIERFRELRNNFSKIDSNGNVYDIKYLGAHHKPLAKHIKDLDCKIKWIIPVVASKRKTYSNSSLPVMEDATHLEFAETIKADETLQDDYLKNRLRGGDKSAYVKYYKHVNDSQTPFNESTIDDNYLTSNIPVSAALETIVNNLEDFYSTVLDAGKDNDAYMRRQYIIQRFNLAESYMAPDISNTGRKVFIRKNITQNDSLTMKSVVVLPKPVMKFSLIDLPGSSILTKSILSQNYLYLFRLLTTKVDVTPRLIDDFNKDMDKNFWEDANSDGSFEKSIQEFMLDETLEQNPERFTKFLQSMVPNTSTIIRMITMMYPQNSISNFLSLKRATNALEPFLIYDNDLNYSQYNAIRFFIKTQSKEYKLKLSKTEDEMMKLRNAQYVGSTPMPHPVELLLSDKRNLFDVVVETYKIHANQKEQYWVSSSEWLSKIYQNDNAQMFYNMIRMLMISLVTPDNISNAINSGNKRANESEDMSKFEKIKPTDCVRRVLTKKYTNMNDLQKDNNTTDIYYDSNFDDTPYELIKLYTEKAKQYTKEDFIEFLSEALVQKHDCASSMANEMAINLIEGKKLINEGEYAILEIRPQLPTSVDMTSLSSNDRRDTDNEANSRKKIAYYKRIGEQWVHEEGIDETAFIDSNELFCNMSKICFRDTKKNVCESIQNAEKRMREISRKQLVNEFDERFAISVETLEEEINDLMQKSVRKLKSIDRLKHVQQYKANNVAFEMGRFVKESNHIVSQYLPIRDKIMGQSDFVKKHTDIVFFVEKYCRDPMVGELDEDPYWLYCTDTNSKLFPTSIFELAKAFILTDNYLHKQSELCRKQGVLSDDGDSIVDKYSGEVLRRIDFVDEQGFDEQGFKIVTSEVFTQDSGDKIVALIEGRKNNRTRVFENEDSEMVYKIIRSISTHVGIQTNTIDDFVLRTSLEIINSDIKNEHQYTEENAKLVETMGKRMPPYVIYRNQYIILIVTSLILVSIQTAIPSFKLQKTFPGCVQSFTGFPDNQGDIGDTTSTQYLACILNSIKTKSSKPWDSIKPLPLSVIKSKLEKTINNSILTRHSLMELYAKKHEYLIIHPNQIIPPEHSLRKWVHFLPPTMEINVIKNLSGIPSEYKNELLEMQKTGNYKQRNQIAMYMTKSIIFGLAVIENVNKIVRNKGLLLKTASNTFFTENACCNDKRTKNTLEYFENENKEITVHVRMVRGWGDIIETTKRRAKASILYYPKRTGISYSIENTNEHFEKNIYVAFIHYCNLNNNIPIPEAMRTLFPEKLPEYNPKASLSDKIELLKRNGKTFTTGNLTQLMEIVNSKNIVHVNTNTNKLKGTRASALHDLLVHLDHKYQSGDDDCNDIPLCDKIRELLNGVLNKYDPKIMVAVDNDETYKLNNWLTYANSNLLDRIVNFISTNSKMSPTVRTKIETQLSDIHIWNIDKSYDKGLSKQNESAMYTVTQFMRESVFAMSKVYPEIILNNHEPSNKSHKHWDFASPHNVDISNFLTDYYKPLKQFKNDNTISSLLNDVQSKLVDLNLFLNVLPAFTPIHHAQQQGDLPANSYYSLFTKRTLYMIYSYTWYSVLYEYIKATDNDNLQKIDINARKNMRRESNIANSDPFKLNMTVEQNNENEISDFTEGLSEIQIIAGDKKQLKTRVSELVLTFINMDGSNKKSLDVSYIDIENRVTRSRMREKKLITDFLRDMDPDARSVEDIKKILKLGRWNAGLRKGLVKYDKSRYIEERAEFLTQLSSRSELEDEDDIPIQRTVEVVEEQENEAIEELYDHEANSISGFRGNDHDGEEDDDDDDF
jgi:transcription termination factor NusB